MDRINDTELLSRLRDMNREFSENELNNIIQNQFLMIKLRLSMM